MSKRDRSSRHMESKSSRHGEDRRNRSSSDEILVPTNNGSGVNPESLKITMENLVALTKGISGNSLDKDSVVACMKGIYDWLTFDSNIPIPLPRSTNSFSSEHMLPHGAVVNTRRQGSFVPDQDDKRYLREVPEDELRCVARSVVSSSQGGDLGRSARGHIIRETAEPPVYAPSLSSSRESYNQYDPISPSPDVHRYRDYTPRPLFEQTPTSPQQDREQLRSPRSVPGRFSILGPLKESAVVPETPTPSIGVVKKKIVRRPKMGTIPRDQTANADGGIPVQFADV